MQQLRHSAAPEAEKLAIAHLNQIVVVKVLLNPRSVGLYEGVADDLVAGLMYANSVSVTRMTVFVAGLVAGKMANVGVIEVASASERISDQRVEFVLSMG